MNFDDFDKLTREELFDLFITQNKTAKEICELYNISTSTFSRRLTKFNIQKDPKLARQISIKNAFFISRETLCDLIFQHGLTKNEICKMYDICISTLDKFLERYNINIKEFKNKNVLNLTYDQVYDLYIIKNLSIEECCAILGISTSVLMKYCRKNNIIKTKDLKKECRKRIFKKEDIYKNKKICLNCGKEFEGHKNQKYCCQKCRSHYLRFGPLPESGIRICKYCGKEYYYTRGEEPRKITPQDRGINAYDVCSVECGVNLRQKHLHDSVYEKYKVDNISQLEEIKKQKATTLFENYGVKGTYSNSELREKILKTREEHKDAISETYVNLWKNRTEEEKQQINENRRKTNKERYDVDWIFELEDETWNEKRYNTHVKNKSFTYSSFEETVAELFDKKNIEYKRQYKSEVYPFLCDFYLPMYDLYIELQGHWSHGRDGKKVYGPYDPNNKDHRKLVEKWESRINIWESYVSSINVWTVRDPLKRETAKKNNLNWMEFFTIDEFMKWYETLPSL